MNDKRIYPEGFPLYGLSAEEIAVAARACEIYAQDHPGFVGRDMLALIHEYELVRVALRACTELAPAGWFAQAVEKTQAPDDAGWPELLDHIARCEDRRKETWGKLISAKVKVLSPEGRSPSALGYEIMRLKAGETATVHILYECSKEDLRTLAQFPAWEHLADYQKERNRYPWERGRIVNGFDERIYCWGSGG